jgi:hypothetical protein
MHKNFVGVLVGVVALSAVASARGGFITDSISVTSPSGEIIGLAINADEEGGVAVGLGEIYEELEPFVLDISGETDSDPVMTITKVVENTTGFEWIGYRIDLDTAGAATFTGTPVSNAFTYDSGASSSTSLVFTPPSSVPSGEAATFVFDILVPTTGPFGFTLTQNPTIIPEPATLLMGLLMAAGGTAVALRYRWG